MRPAAEVFGEEVRRDPAPGLDACAFTADELAGSPAPFRPWHVKNMVPIKAVTLLQGDGGTGKSLLALQLAVSTVLGRPWLGQEVRRGNVLYLSAEDDRDEVHRRLEAITLDHGVDLADLPGLKVLDMTGRDSILAAADRTGRLLATDLWEELEQLIAQWEPVLIAIDNLADVFAGEENSRPHARQFVSQLQGCAGRSNAAVLLIGHPSLAGIASGSGSSGSTAWNNSVRSRLYLTRPGGSEDGFTSPDVRVLTVKKANYAPSSVELRLRWQAGAFVADQADGDAPTSLDAQVAQNRVDKTFLDLLTRYASQGRTVSDQKGANYAPTEFAKDPQANGITKSGFAAAMNRLFAHDLIAVEIVGPASRRRRQLVTAAPKGVE